MANDTPQYDVPIAKAIDYIREKRILKSYLFSLVLLVVLQIICLDASSKTYFTVRSSTKISLITVAPGKEAYSSFGHSAVRIRDQNANFDLVFNYGTFDFDEPGFYRHFMQGKLNFYLVIVSTPEFLHAYEQEDRMVIETPLILDSFQKQIVFDYLMTNAEPENRQYKYDFFYANCATKVQDLFQSIPNIHLNYTSDKYRNDISMHRMLDPYLNHRPWTRLGFYLILGLPSERPASHKLQAFLPDYLKISIEQATNGSNKLAEEDLIINNPKNSLVFRPLKCSLWDQTLLLPLVLFVALMSARLLRHTLVLDLLLFTVTACLGFLFLTMWLFTDHVATYGNMNLLWAWPSNIVVIPLLFIQRYSRVVKVFIKLFGFWLLGLFFASFFLTQDFHPTIRFLILEISIYCLTIRQKINSPNESYTSL